MASNGRSGLPAKGQTEARPVLVNLDALFPQPTQPVAVDGLRCSGWTAGGLHRWIRGADGQWIGVVTILFKLTGGGTYKAEDQLVPAEALRRR